MIFIIGSSHSVYATTTVLSDEMSCNTLGGVWTVPPPLCTFSTELIITEDDSLIVNPGITLKFSPGYNLTNGGTITNNGHIELTGIDKGFTGRIRNENSSTFVNAGTINFTGSSGPSTGQLENVNTTKFTNTGTINLSGSSGIGSGSLKIFHSSVVENTGTIILQGSNGDFSGYIGVINSGTFLNSGSIIITAGSGKHSGLLDNWDKGYIENDNTGSILITGSTGDDSGIITNMGESNFKNRGDIFLTGGSGTNTGYIANSQQAIFENLKTIVIISGTGPNISHIYNLDNGIFTNRATITTDENFLNNAALTNFGDILVGNDLNNLGSITDCGKITIIGIIFGKPVIRGCQGTSNSHEDPTIGKTSYGIQVVENGICINIKCWTVTADYHQDFKLVEMLSNSIHTISTTVYCHNGVAKCNYVAFGVSPYGTNINHSVWKVILEKDHLDNWSMSVIDPDGYLDAVTSTTQIINDGKHLAASMTGLFIKPTPGMILNVEVRDSYGGYRDFKFNDGIEIVDIFEYPYIETSYELPLVIEKLCLNENPNKRYTCAFDKVREWTIKNAEIKLSEIK